MDLPSHPETDDAPDVPAEGPTVSRGARILVGAVIAVVELGDVLADGLDHSMLRPG